MVPTASRLTISVGTGKDGLASQTDLPSSHVTSDAESRSRKRKRDKKKKKKKRRGEMRHGRLRSQLASEE